MSYAETIQYLYNAAPPFHLIGGAAYKPGLQNMEALMTIVGHPERKLKAIHIAGTNGKGSTSHLIAAALQAAGNRVGLYTSPHLVDFRERIRINGEMIAEDEVVAFVACHKEAIETIQPSFFEITTAMAFYYFAKQNVDYAVIEVGLGGRLDATNVLPPENVCLSIITNIGFDHTEFLGNTLAAIASEKAGIIKRSTPVVIGEADDETRPVFEAKANAVGAPIYFAWEHEYLRRVRMRVAPVSELQGYYQEHNLQTAFVALRALSMPNTAIAEGFAHVCSITGLRGRWETLSHAPLTICDTGHNSHGLRYVFQQLNELHQRHGGTLRIVFGMVKDKDIDVVRQLLPTDAVYYFCQAKTSRAIPADMTVEQAVKKAQNEASPDDIIFIGGSNYVVGEALLLTYS